MITFHISFFCDVINIFQELKEIGRDNYPQQLRLSPSLFTSVKHIEISTYEFDIFFTNLIQSQS